ncbi:MAG TPA: Bax inhibitor-1/YccA family protein [Verrucomicrobiae bacterium]|jgi:FtsH-binding integral membrane protein|nr:Bax inhibitor-1/YccA family protein [Verrucomicrobiae bacterium]
MSDYHSQTQSVPTGRADMAVDAGLRAFMLGVYNKMAVGLLLTGVLAYVVGTTPALMAAIFSGPQAYLVMFGPLAILLISSFAMRNPSPAAANIVYWSVVTLIGIGMGALVYAYAGIPNGMVLVAKAFLITSATFGGLSLWGYTTKRDLTGFGTFLIMGVIGLVIASVVNMFLQSDALSFAISIIGVLVFAGLTAFDTQRLKYTYYALGGDQRAMSVATTFGALSLYINFINLFQFILSLLSPRN